MVGVRLEEDTDTSGVLCEIDMWVATRARVLRACVRMKKSLIVKMAAPNVQLLWLKCRVRNPRPKVVNKTNVPGGRLDGSGFASAVIRLAQILTIYKPRKDAGLLRLRQHRA